MSQQLVVNGIDHLLSTTHFVSSSRTVMVPVGDSGSALPHTNIVHTSRVVLPDTLRHLLQAYGDFITH